MNKVVLMDAQEFIDDYHLEGSDDLFNAVEELAQRGSEIAKFCIQEDFGVGAFASFHEWAEDDLVEQLSDEIASEDNDGWRYHPDYILYDDFLIFVENTLLKFVLTDGYLSEEWKTVETEE